MIKILDSRDARFDAELRAALAFDEGQDAEIENRVADIIREVRERGDAALLEYTRRFDRLDVETPAALELDRAVLQDALRRIPGGQRQALEEAALRIRLYHERQVQSSWRYTEADGTVLGQQVTALDRVGLYVPGGKAAYPSSVLMNALPARVAGVG